MALHTSQSAYHLAAEEMGPAEHPDQAAWLESDGSPEMGDEEEEEAFPNGRQEGEYPMECAGVPGSGLEEGEEGQSET